MGISKTTEAKLGLDKGEFHTVDGRKLKLSDHFTGKDFVSDDGSGAFIRHNSLLRVCKELFYITSRDVRIEQVPRSDNRYSATAVVTYVLIPKIEKLDVRDEDKEPIAPRQFSFSSSADCYFGNHPPQCDKYMTAMAETRASGRALRFLLGVEFCTKEEIADNTEEVELDNAPIKPNTVMTIEKKFMGQHGITIEQIRKLIKKPDLETISTLTIAEGAVLTQKLHRNLEKLSKVM